MAIVYETAAPEKNPRIVYDEPSVRAEDMNDETYARLTAEADIADKAARDDLELSTRAETEKNKPGSIRTVLNRGATRVAGAADLTANVASGIPASLAGGLTYLGTAAGTGGDVDAAEAVRQGTQEALTWKPRTEMAEKGLQGAAEALAPLGKMRDAAAEGTRKGLTAVGAPPELAAGVATAVHMIPDVAMQAAGVKPTLAAGRALTSTAERLPGAVKSAFTKTEVPPTAPTNPTELARALDIKVKPSETKGAAKVGSAIEGPAGSSKLDTQLSIQNQPKITTHVRDDLKLNLPADQIVTPKVLNEAKSPYNAKYAAVGETLGKVDMDTVFKDAVKASDSRGSKIIKTPVVEALKRKFAAVESANAGDLVHEVRVLRDEARLNRNSDKTALVSKGRAQQKIADAIEDLLDRTGRARGHDQLMNELKDARVELAKIHSAEEALLPDGSFDAHNFAKQLKDGVPLSGRMRMIAEVAGNHASVVRPALKIRDKTGSSALDTATLGIRPLARKALASDFYQNRIGKPAADIGPNSPLADYFTKPRTRRGEASPVTPRQELPQTQASAMLRAQQMAGDLELQPESFSNAVEVAPTRARPGDLTADTPEAVRGDVNFTASEPLLADIMSGNLRTTSEVPQSIPREIAQEPTLAQLMDEAVSSLQTAKPKVTDQTPLPLKGGEMVDRLALEPPAGKIGKEPSQRAHKVSVEADESGLVTIKSANGETLAQENGKYLQAKSTKTEKKAQRTGENRARYDALFDEASSRGLTLASDFSVSKPQVAFYEKLKKDGWEIKQNPSEPSARGGLVSKDVRTPVFEVISMPKKPKS